MIILRSWHLAADSQVPEGEIQKHLAIKVLKAFERKKIIVTSLFSANYSEWRQKSQRQQEFDHISKEITCSRSSGGKSNREDILPFAAMDWYFLEEKNSAMLSQKDENISQSQSAS